MMDHTNMSHRMPKTMAEMPMTFFTSTTTPLYSSAWTPKTAAQYALTCLFLVLLCIVFRGLLAARCNMPWLLAYTSPKKAASEEVSCCAEEVGLQKPLHGDLAPGSANRHQDRPSKVWEILLRAVLDTALAVVSYLL
jgi:copper transporter 1